MTAAAAESGLFLREALWSAYLPKFDVIRQLLDDEVLGTIHSVQADMGEYFPADHRIMRAGLSGGARYDLLTYPLWFARWVLGPLETVQDLATPAPPALSPDGVEGQIAVVQRTAAGAVAVLFASVLGDTPTTPPSSAPGPPSGWTDPSTNPEASRSGRTTGGSCATTNRRSRTKDSTTRRLPSPAPWPHHSTGRRRLMPDLTSSAAGSKATNTDPRARATIGVCSDQWGMWFPEDEKQMGRRRWTRWPRPGFSVMETGPVVYPHRDPVRLEDEMDRRRFRVVAGTGWGILHKAEAWAETETTYRAIARPTPPSGRSTSSICRRCSVTKDREYTDDRVLRRSVEPVHRGADPLGRILKEDYGLKMVLHPTATATSRRSTTSTASSRPPSRVRRFCLDTGDIVYGGGDPWRVPQVSRTHLVRPHQGDRPGLVQQAHDEDWPLVTRWPGCSVAPPAGAPDMPALVEALADLDKELYVVYEQDIYACDPSYPSRTPQTREYLASCGLGLN